MTYYNKSIPASDSYSDLQRILKERDDNESVEAQLRAQHMSLEEAQIEFDKAQNFFDKCQTIYRRGDVPSGGVDECKELSIAHKVLDILRNKQIVETQVA